MAMVTVEDMGVMVLLETKLSLRPVTSETVRAVCALEVHGEQQGFVATNAISIAEAYYDKSAWFRAIYWDELLIGFVMLSEDHAQGEYYLWRFMIDKKYQGMGYGKKAIETIIEHVKSMPKARELTLSCVPGEGGPEDFYKKLGFQFTGKVDEGEKVYRLAF